MRVSDISLSDLIYIAFAARTSKQSLLSPSGLVYLLSVVKKIHSAYMYITFTLLHIIFKELDVYTSVACRKNLIFRTWEKYDVSVNILRGIISAELCDALLPLAIFFGGGLSNIVYFYIYIVPLNFAWHDLHECNYILEN